MPKQGQHSLSPTEAEILKEAGGNVYLALARACDLYDYSRSLVSAGYARANTSKIKWQPKPALSDDATDDSWLASGKTVNDD